MRVSAMMDQRKTIETILRHLNLWSGLPVFKPSRSPPAVIPKHREAEACIASIRISNNAVPTAIFAESPGCIAARSSIKGARVWRAIASAPWRRDDLYRVQIFPSRRSARPLKRIGLPIR